jgi:CheY-like chemotaxis protein
MNGQPLGELPEPMCIAIADDDPELLGFVERWVSELPNAEALTCHRLQNFQAAIREKLQQMKSALNETTEPGAGRVRILIFLDLIWGPGHNPTPGLNFLNTLRADPQLRCYPIIIYSQTNADDEIKQCYCRQASAFLTKGPDKEFGPRERFLQVVQTWRTVMTLPSAGDIP